MVKPADWRKGEILSDEMFDETLEKTKNWQNTGKKLAICEFVLFTITLFLTDFGLHFVAMSLSSLVVGLAFIIIIEINGHDDEERIRGRMIYKKLLALEKKVR